MSCVALVGIVGSRVQRVTLLRARRPARLLRVLGMGSTQRGTRIAGSFWRTTALADLGEGWVGG
jgi:hypothetical protein